MPTTKTSARTAAEKSVSTPPAPAKNSGQLGTVAAYIDDTGRNTVVTLEGFGSGRHFAAVRLFGMNEVAFGVVFDGDEAAPQTTLGTFASYVATVDDVEHRGNVKPL